MGGGVRCPASARLPGNRLRLSRPQEAIPVPRPQETPPPPRSHALPLLSPSSSHCALWITTVPSPAETKQPPGAQLCKAEGHKVSNLRGSPWGQSLVSPRLRGSGAPATGWCPPRGGGELIPAKGLSPRKGGASSPMRFRLRSSRLHYRADVGDGHPPAETTATRWSRADGAAEPPLILGGWTLGLGVRLQLRSHWAGGWGRGPVLPGPTHTRLWSAVLVNERREPACRASLRGPGGRQTCAPRLGGVLRKLM